MSDQGNDAPPQWAEDPSGRHVFRFWDGRQWTGHVGDDPVPPHGFPDVAPHPDPSAHSPQGGEPTIAGARAGDYEDVAATSAIDPEFDEPRTRRRGGTPREPSEGGGRRAFGVGALVGLVIGAVIGVGASKALDSGSSNSSASTTATTRHRSSSTTTTVGFDTTTTGVGSVTTTLAAATATARPPAQVKVAVLNGSGVAGAAGTKATALKKLGYVITGTGNATARQGTVVECATGYDAEAAALTQALGAGATTAPLPSPAPAGTTGANCVVIVGK